MYQNNPNKTPSLIWLTEVRRWPMGKANGGRPVLGSRRGAVLQERLVGFQQTLGGILPALNQTGEGFLLTFVPRC